MERHRASLARVHQARALPYPVVSYDSDLQPKVFRFAQEGESYLGVSQTLEFPGKRGVRGRIAAREADDVLASADRVRLSLAFQVRRAFGALLLAQEKLHLARQDLELAEDFLAKTEVKLRAGDVARVEVLRARVEASRAANAQRVTANRVQLARAHLAFLLARPEDQSLEISGELGRAPLPPDLDLLTQRALRVRPDIRQMEFAILREGLVKKQATLEYLPDVDVGVAQHRIAGEPTTWDVTVSLPVPLFFWQPRRGAIAEAQANMRALDREAEYLRNAVRLEVEEAYMNAVSARDRIRLFESEILAQAEEAHDMYLFSYQEGEIGGIELIEARRTLIEARGSHADALFEYDVALAALEQAVGE
jgi:cobalt-zinc-cadmium efflux system outer membrane protein